MLRVDLIGEALTMRSGPTDAGRMLFWIGPPGAAGDALIAEVERNAQLTVKRIERNS
jgi:hypothetical protein